LEAVAVDSLDRFSSNVALLKEEKPLSVRDLRLSIDKALDPRSHFSEQKHSSVVYPGEVFEINLAESLEVSVYDTLPKVFSLLSAINNGGSSTSLSPLKKFQFLLSWNTLSAEQKMEKYSKYASHELHLFLAKHDRAFFDQNIIPYLRNKSGVGQCSLHTIPSLILFTHYTSLSIENGCG